MENLINYLLQFGQLNTQQIDLLKSKAKEMYLKKVNGLLTNALTIIKNDLEK